jgi:tetratricopeptide (TPR) repeat protein
MVRRRIVWGGLLLAAAGAGLLAGRRGGRGETPVAFDPAAIRDQEIAFYQARVARDPLGARDLAVLAALHLERGQATGSDADLVRAEALARRSFSHRRSRNSGAAVVLAASLAAQHRFGEAYTVARDLAEFDPAPVSRALVGEIALELGRYDEAARWMASIRPLRFEPAIAPRYARWLELEGRPGEARDLLDAARQRLQEQFGTPASQLAWFDLRLGELAFRNGRLDLAEQAYRRGLGLLPGDRRLLAARARLEAARGHWRQAIGLAEDALAQGLDPAVLALLSDAWRAAGDTGRAAEYSRALETAVALVPGDLHRAWELFRLDHGGDARAAARRALAGLQRRRDVYGSDLAAWALYRAGRPRDAWPFANQALARGTRDGLLHYHAGRIALALGDSARARRELETALAISPRFDPWHADTAAALADALRRRAGP